jgi:HSP20 family molecular chaperone IbpA
LIDRWRVGSQAAAALVEDKKLRYEVRIPTAGANPRQTEIEVTEYRLRVRLRAGASKVSERSFSFTQPVDREAVTAHWSDDTLLIILPKQKVRRGKAK